VGHNERLSRNSFLQYQLKDVLDHDTIVPSGFGMIEMALAESIGAYIVAEEKH